MSYYPYYNYGYMPPNGQPCSDSNIQYQAQQPGQQQGCPTNIQYQPINGCAPFNPCSLDAVASTTDVMSGTVPYLNKDKTAYTTSNNITYDPDAHGGKGKFYIKGGFDPMYVQVEPQASNPNVGQTGTIWYDKDDNNLYIDNAALVKNGSNYIQLKRNTVRPVETVGATGIVWIKESSSGDKSLYIDDKIVSGGGEGGNASSSGGLGDGATGTSITLFSSVTNPKPDWIESQVVPSVQNPGTLWVNPQGSLMFNESQVIGPAGTALYATDPWMTKYILGQPPAPTQETANLQTLVANGQATANSSYSSTTTDIDIRWTPIEQRYIGLIDAAVPVIKEFQIRVIDSSATPVITVILDTKTASTAIKMAVLPTKINRLLINKSSTPTNSEILTPQIINGVTYTTFKWYKGAAALVEPLRVEIWYENGGNYDNLSVPAIPYNKLSITDVRFSPPGPPSNPSVSVSVSVLESPTDSTITVNLTVPLAVNRVIGGGYTDKFNLNNDSPIKFYNIYYKEVSSRKISGTNIGIERSIVDILATAQATLGNNYLVKYIITGLNPVTTYEIQITARSDALQTRESDRSASITVETTIPTPITTSQIQNINLASLFTSVYGDNAYLTTNNSRIEFNSIPILSKNIEWFLNLGPIYISLEPETTYSKIEVSVDVEDNPYDILSSSRIPYILYGNGITGPIIGGTGSITNPSDIKIQLYNGNTNSTAVAATNTSIIDPNNDTAASGLYLKAYFGIRGTLPGFPAGSSPNSLEIKLITGRNATSTTTTSKLVNFYMDSLPINEKPQFVNAPGPDAAENITLVNESSSTNTVNVCGLGLNNGNWKIRLANIKTKYVMYYFYNNPILEYKFANMPNYTTLLGNPTDDELQIYNAANGEVILYPLISARNITGKIIEGIETLFSYLPKIFIKANNINKLDAYNNLKVDYEIKMIVDPATINALNNLSNSTLMNAGSDDIANTFVKGQRMITSRKANFNDFIRDYRTSRHIFDNTNCILFPPSEDIDSSYISPWRSDTANSGSSDKIIYAANDLQLMNGKFMTRAYTGPGSKAAYKNYATILIGTGYAKPDYSGLVTETKYRYVTLRWQYTAAKISGLEFRINGIDCLTTTPLTLDSLTGLYIGTGVNKKQLQFFYRIEQPDIAGTSIQTYSSDIGNDLINGNPSNKPFSLSNGFGLSTVWINANSTTNNDDFSRYSSAIPSIFDTESTILGGLSMINSTNISISDGTNPIKTVTYNVTTPVFDLSAASPVTNRYVNVYAMIGIPMDADFAFADIDCKVKNDGNSTIPDLTGGNYIDDDIGLSFTTTNDYSTASTYGYISSAHTQIQSTDIIIRDTDSQQTRQIQPQNYIYISPDSQTLTSRINASITKLGQTSTTQIVYDDNQDVQVYNTPIITTSTDNVLTLSNREVPPIVDAYASGLSSQKGYYMLTKINLAFNTNSLTGVQLIATNDVYPITLSQTYKLASDSSDTVKSRIIKVHMDKLPLNTLPNISRFIVDNNGLNMLHISGVSVNDGNWSIAISNVVTTNTIYYFYSNPILQYTFMNNPIQPLLTSTTKTSSTGAITFFNTEAIPAESSQVVSASTQVQTYVYRPTFRLTANNINKSNNTFTTLPTNIEMILDYPSINLVTNILPQTDLEEAPGLPGSSTAATITTATYGRRMKTDTSSYINTVNVTFSEVTNPIFEFLNNYSAYRELYNNSDSLTTQAINDLQIVNGAFVTPMIDTNSYIDYTLQGGPNYAIIRSEGLIGKYRWATFRWQFKSTTFQATRLEFYIDNIYLGSGYSVIRGNTDIVGGTDTVSLYIKNNTSGVHYKLQFYYRFEQPSLVPSGGEAGDPYNITDTQAAGSISSVWVDATSNINNDSFGQLLGIKAYSGLLGGIKGIDTDMAISSTNVKLNVSTPTLNLQPASITDKKINIYALIGLPMDIPISIKGIKCNVY